MLNYYCSNFIFRFKFKCIVTFFVCDSIVILYLDFKVENKLRNKDDVVNLFKNLLEKILLYEKKNCM